MTIKNKKIKIGNKQHHYYASISFLVPLKLRIKLQLVIIYYTTITIDSVRIQLLKIVPYLK